MLAAVIAASLAGYAVVTLGMARRLFASWRPHRVPVCGDKHSHSYLCYRRIRPDLTSVHIDGDRQAATCALLASLLWPFIFLYHVVAVRQPETEPERLARLIELQKQIDKAEKRLEGLRD